MSKNKPKQNSTENYHKGSCVEFFLSKGIPSRNTTHEHLGETSLIFVQTGNTTQKYPSAPFHIDPLKKVTSKSDNCGH